MVHYATIAPRISGQVATVAVDDNDIVKAGQVLATLDPRDNETALASAQATVARDRAQLDQFSATVSRQPSIIAEQQAAVASARAKLAFAQADAHRYGNLARTGAGTVREHQQADSTLQQGQASLDSAEASLDAARRQLDVLKGRDPRQRRRSRPTRLNLNRRGSICPIRRSGHRSTAWWASGPSR